MVHRGAPCHTHLLPTLHSSSSVLSLQEEAIVVAKFSGRHPDIGLCTVELRKADGRILAFAPADLELVRPASAEHQVLRHGTEAEFQALVGWLPLRNAKVDGEGDGWLNSAGGAKWLAAGPTEDKQSGSTDLHYLCSNPNLTVSMLTAVHRRRAQAEGKHPVEPDNQGGGGSSSRGPHLALHELRNHAALTPLHNLCGNLHVTYSMMKYMLEAVVCPCTFYTSASCSHRCCAEAAVNAHDLSDKSGGGGGAAAAAAAGAGGGGGGTGGGDGAGGDSRGEDRGLPTPLHVYTRGLPMSVEVLELLLAAAGGLEGNSPRMACSIADGEDSEERCLLFEHTLPITAISF